MKHLILIPAFFLLFGGALKAQVVVSRKAHIEKREINTNGAQRVEGVDKKHASKPTLTRKTTIFQRKDLKFTRTSEKKSK